MPPEKHARFVVLRNQAFNLLGFPVDPLFANWLLELLVILEDVIDESNEPTLTLLPHKENLSCILERLGVPVN